MNDRISINKGENYVHSYVYASISMDILAELMIKTSEKGKEWGFNRYLVDFRGAEKILGVLDDYNVAYVKAKEFGLKPGGTRHALIVRHEDIDEFGFVETVFQNAGYILKIFTEEDAAIRWIKK